MSDTSKTMSICEQQTEIQLAELVRQTLATFPVENIIAVINTILKRVGTVECLQILTSTAKQVALEKVTSEMSDKVTGVVDIWMHNQLNSETGGKKSLREALKATANPKALEFVRQELRLIGPEILKGLITLHGDVQTEEYVRSHIPVIAATIMTNIVKRFAEDHVQAVGTQGLKDAVAVQAPEAVRKLMESTAPQAVQDGLRKQVDIQAPDVVANTLQVVAKDVVSGSVRDEAHIQVPEAVSKEIGKLSGVIEDAVAKEAQGQVVPVVRENLSLTVDKILPGIVIDETKKQAPEAVSHSITENVDPIVKHGLVEVSNGMTPEHVQASLEKQTEGVVKANLDSITPDLAETEAKAEVKVQTPGVVTRALNTVVPDLATSAATQAAEEQAGPAVAKELLDSKDKNSGIVTDAVHAQAEKQAPGAVSEMIAVTDVKGIAVASLTDQAKVQAPGVVTLAMEESAPNIVTTDLKRVSQEMAPRYVEASLTLRVTDIVMANLNDVTPPMAKAKAKAEVDAQAGGVITTALNGVAREIVKNAAHKAANEQAGSVVAGIFAEEREQHVADIAETVHTEAVNHAPTVVLEMIATIDVQGIAERALIKQADAESPSVVLEAMNQSADRIVRERIGLISDEMIEPDIERRVSELSPAVVETSLEKIVPQIAETEAKAEVKVQTPGVVTRALNTVVPDLATSAATQAAEEQAGPAVAKELLDSKDKNSGIVTDAVHAQAEKQAPGAVSEMIAVTDVKGIAVASLTDQAKVQAPDAVHTAFEAALPSIVREKGETEVSSQITDAVAHAVEELKPVIRQGVVKTVEEDIPAIVNGLGLETAGQMLRENLPKKINERATVLVDQVSSMCNTDELASDLRARLELMMGEEVEEQRTVVKAAKKKINDHWFTRLLGVVLSYKIRNSFTGSGGVTISRGTVALSVGLVAIAIAIFLVMMAPSNRSSQSLPLTVSETAEQLDGEGVKAVVTRNSESEDSPNNNYATTAERTDAWKIIVSENKSNVAIQRLTDDDEDDEDDS